MTIFQATTGNLVLLKHSMDIPSELSHAVTEVWLLFTGYIGHLIPHATLRSNKHVLARSDSH